MKQKIKEIIEDEEKRSFLVLMIVVFIVTYSVVTIYLLHINKERINEITTTTITTTTTNKYNRLKGFITYELEENDISYDLYKYNEFVYANGEDKEIIYLTKDDIDYYYEVSLNDGSLLFTELKYLTDKSSYEYTNNKYIYKTDNNITDYIIINGCNRDEYSILIKDSKNYIYSLSTTNDEYSIDELINSIKKVKTITNVSKIGYYSGSNNPNTICSYYELIYLDTNNNIRLLSNKNSLFMSTAYYRYVGSTSVDNHIYVLKDGLMKYDIGNNSSYLYNGDYHIYYKGSFYTLNGEIEDIYIISKDNYLYKIENISESSEVLLKYVNESKIKRVGTRTVTNENDYATDKNKVIIYSIIFFIISCIVVVLISYIIYLIGR